MNEIQHFSEAFKDHSSTLITFAILIYGIGFLSATVFFFKKEKYDSF